MKVPSGLLAVIKIQGPKQKQGPVVWVEQEISQKKNKKLLLNPKQAGGPNWLVLARELLYENRSRVGLSMRVAVVAAA